MTTSVSDIELAQLIASLGATPPPAAAPAVPRCTVTELLVDQCACALCRPAPPADETEPRLGPWITSMYRGRCSGCGRSFDELEEIRADGDGGWLADCCGHVPTRRTDPLDGLIAAAAPEMAALDASNPLKRIAAELDGPCTCGPKQYCHRNNCHGGQPAPAAPPVQTPTAGPPPSTVAEMREVLADLDASRPRSRQTALGPSELGTPCQRQIAMKLAGVIRQPEDKRPPWAPMQGTAMHTLMEEALRFHNAQLGRERWVVEGQLTIHPGVGGDDPGIRGHGDAFDTDYGTVVDWKYVGVTTLREVKRKTIPNEQLVKAEYRIQAHLYGLGHERAGRDVRFVRLVFLARSHDYADSTEWTEEYKPELAAWAVDRYYATIELLTALDVANTPALWPAVPATPGKACDWCPFRRVGGPADVTGCPGNTDQQISKQLHGLIA